jgi:Putative beta-barrel porin-2, OmpL-like. bbp2
MLHRWRYGIAILACAPAALAEDAATRPAAPDADAEFREYVKRLEQRVEELERAKDWPLDEAPKPAASPLEAAIRSVNLSGFIEYDYSHNFRHGGSEPGRRGDTFGYNQLRGPDSDESGFILNAIQLDADRPLTTVGSTGFHVSADYGIVAAQSHLDPNFDGGGGGSSDNAFDVREGWMAWRAPFEPLDHVDFAVGKFRAPLGFETFGGLALNWQVTRNPISVYGTPTTFEGLRASLPFEEKFTANVFFVNGWDEVRDGNDGKTGVVNLVFGRFDTLSSQFQVNASYGATEGVGSHQGDKRRFFELVWDGKLDEATEFALDGIWGDAPGRSWHGAAAYARYHATGTLWFSARAGWYADEALGTDGARIVDGTVAVGCDVAKDLTVALEYRHDFSRSAGTYLDSSGNPSDHQDTLTAAFVYRF